MDRMACAGLPEGFGERRQNSPQSQGMQKGAAWPFSQNTLHLLGRGSFIPVHQFSCILRLWGNLQTFWRQTTQAKWLEKVSAINAVNLLQMQTFECGCSWSPQLHSRAMLWNKGRHITCSKSWLHKGCTCGMKSTVVHKWDTKHTKNVHCTDFCLGLTQCPALPTGRDYKATFRQKVGIIF